SIIVVFGGLIGIYKITQQTGLHFWYGVLFLVLSTVILFDLCASIIKLSQRKLYLYTVTSIIGMLLLFISYLADVWIIGIMFFPIIWGGIYKYLSSRSRRQQH